MTTLHIEHAVSDFQTWRAAYDRFAERRREAGVVRERISRPTHDPCYVVVDLDFGTAVQAERFEQFLRQTVWASPANAPALVGAPTTRLLDLVHEALGS